MGATADMMTGEQASLSSMSLHQDASPATRHHASLPNDAVPTSDVVHREMESHHRADAALKGQGLLSFDEIMAQNASVIQGEIAQMLPPPPFSPQEHNFLAEQAEIAVMAYLEGSKSAERRFKAEKKVARFVTDDEREGLGGLLAGKTVESAGTAAATA